MKQQWKNEKDVATLEEGLQQEQQGNIIKFKHNTNNCKKWIRYIKLIFLLELTLFFGWSCYKILQNYYYFQATENEVRDIIRERFPVFESVPEEQKSHPTTDMPYSRVTFVKDQVTDKLNNFLGVELSKEQDKTIAIDVDISTSTPNSISTISNNMAKVSNINNFLKSLPEDSVYDKEIMKNLMSSKISSTTEYTDKIINTDNNKDSVNSKFLEKLQNIAKLINDFQGYKNNYDFTKDLIKDTIQVISNHNGKSSSGDRNDEQVNILFDSDLVICPPYQSYESSDMSPEHSIKDSSTSQAVSIPEFIEQIKNIYNDDGTKNKDEHNTDDSNMLMSASSDVSMFGSNDYLNGYSEWLFTPIQNSQDYHSDYQSEITANVKQEKEKHKFMKNIESLFNFEFSQPKIQDTSVESSTSNDKFQWFNAPPVSANDLQLGLKDISESSQTQNPSLENTIKDINIINAFIPEKDKLHNKCHLDFIMDEIFRINCSGTMVDEQRNLVPPPTLTTDSSNVNFKDIFGLSVDDYDEDKSEQLKGDVFIFNENLDNFEKVASLQHSTPEVTDEITTSMPRDLRIVFDKHDGVHSSDQEKIKEKISSSSTTIPSFTSTFDLSDFNLDFNTESQEVSDTLLQTKKLKAREDHYRKICSIIYIPELCSNSDELY